MPEPPVANTSPLIILSRAGALDFLHLVGGSILIPAAVAREVAAYGPDDQTVRAITEADWLVIVDVPEVPSPLRDLDLGAGETAALAWALAHSGTTAIIDDDEARRAARTLGVPVIGTLGLILGAKEHGLIALAAPVVQRAREAGLYLSERLIRESLRRVGE